MRAPALALALVLLGAAAPGRAVPVVVPLSTESDHLFTTVRVNGSAPLRFVIDTAGGEMLDARAAEELGLAHGRSVGVRGVGARTERAWLTRARRVQIGDAELDDVPFVVLPIASSFGVAEGSRIDGMIGPALLAHFTVTFDPAGGSLALAPPGPVGIDGEPLELGADQHPSAACTVAGIATRCALDTGSRLAVTLLRGFLDGHPALSAQPSSASGVDGYGIGGAARGRLTDVDVTLGGRTVRVVGDLTEQRTGAFAHGGPIGANVGERLLRRYVVTFDAAHKRVAFAPSRAFGEPERVDRSGLFVIRRDGATSVLDVRPLTPAASAGLRADDEIVAVDGIPAASLSLGAIRARLSDPLTERVVLRVRDATGERDVTVALADYVPSRTLSSRAAMSS